MTRQDLAYLSFCLVFVGALILLAAGYETLALSIAFFWLLIVGFFAICQEEAQRVEWERYYASMTIDQKIDYHLDRARQSGLNYHANIAQALIERKRDGALK